MAEAALNTAEFARRMDVLGPFEPHPVIALAVSGGADSMSLALLAKQWLDERSGTLHALTVDHGLRPESVAEARQVGAWMAKHGITHRILRWAVPHHGAGLQAAARAARYELLESWCGKHRVLHLLVGHNAGDQAETVLMRLRAGSGVRGLAGMPSVAERQAVRVLRPLLPYTRVAIRQYLEQSGQAWIEDPSNEDTTFARVRLRRQAPTLSGLGLTPSRLRDTAAKLGDARAALETATARFCALTILMYPSGYAIFDSKRLAQVQPEIGRGALAAIITAVNGRVYGPRSERLNRLYQSARDNKIGRARTLAGCRVGPWRGRLLVSREVAAKTDPVRIPSGGGVLRWDGRFCAVFRTAGDGNLWLRALGREGLAQIGAARGPIADAIPDVVRPTLPTIWRGDLVLAVPHLGYKRIGGPAGAGMVKMAFVPPQPMSPPAFGIV